MVIQRTPPRYPRRGPSCTFVLFVLFGIGVSMFVMANREQVREAIIPTPLPEPTRSATEYAVLGDLSERDGEYAQAIEFYESAIRLDATKPEIFIRLINLLIKEKRTEEALTMAEQAIVLASDNDQVWMAAAAAYIANGNRLRDKGDRNGANLQYEQAFQTAQQAIDLNGDNASAYAYAAAGLILQRDPNKFGPAQEYADTAIFLDGENPLGRLYMAYVFEELGQYTAAIEQYQLGIDSRATPGTPYIGLNMADLHVGLAYNFYGTSNIPQAILSFQDAIAVDPTNAVAYDGLAFMYLQLGEDALAEENARKAVELDPTMARAHARLGQAFFRQNNYPQAIEELELAVELYEEPNYLNATYFNMLAIAYYRTESNCDSAVPIFQQVLRVALPESAAEADAREGLELCRLANIESNQ